MWNEDLHYSSELLLKEIHQRMLRPPGQSLTGRTSRLSGTLNILSLALLSHLILLLEKSCPWSWLCQLFSHLQGAQCLLV